MKEFMTKLLVLFLILIGGIAQADDVQVDFYLSAKSEEDCDATIMKELLFFHLYSQVSSEGKMDYAFIPDQGGRFVFEGTEDQLETLVLMFWEKLEESITPEGFLKGKEAFLLELQKNGALFEMGIAEEMEWEDLSFAKSAVKEVLLALKERYLQQKCTPLSNKLSPDSSSSNDLFYNLRLTIEDQKNIEKLVKNLADLNVFELLLKKREMEKLGEKIDPVHPMRFIGYIHSRHDLRKRLAKIKESHFKWKSFAGGFSERMSLEASRNNVLKYAPGFSHSSGVHLDKVEAYIHRRDWEGLVHRLI